MTDHLLCYEHPLNERIRSCLRLEFLFDEFHRLDAQSGSRRQLIAVINDLLSLLTRADAWSELGKDLQHEIDQLLALSDNPDVDHNRLNSILEPLQAAAKSLAQADVHEVQIPKLLLAVMQRASVPGGTAPPDMPGFTFWLCRSDTEQRADIARWTSQFGRFEEALRVFLSLVRNRGEWQLTELTHAQCSLQVGNRLALLRIALPTDVPWYPEVSGGRHRLNIRLRSIEASDSNEAMHGVPDLQIALC